MKLKIYSFIPKTLLIGIIFFFNANVSMGSVPPWLWAKSAGGSLWDEAHSVTTDPSGNIIVVGYFTDSIIVFGTDTLRQSVGSVDADLFIVKYDVYGNVLWAKSAGGNYDDNANSVITDSSGNIFVAGEFRSDSIFWGNDTLTNDSSYWFYNIFIVKLDANGNALWAKSANGTHDAEARFITLDVWGNILVTGIYSTPTLTFGTDTLHNALPGYVDFYFVKYDAAGNLLLAKSGGGNNNDDAHSLTTDASGNIILEGTYTSDTIIFGIDTLFNNSAGSTADIFVTKYDATGNVLWVKNSQGDGDDQSTCITTDGVGNIILTGTFSGPYVVFGNDTLNLDTTVYPYNSDLFLVKFNSNGNVLWAKTATGAFYDQANSVTTDVNDHIFIAGYYNSPTIIFGNDTLSNDTANGSSEMFVAKYDINGNELWAKSADGSGHENAKSLTVDITGNIIVTGRFEQTVAFGADVLQSAGTMNVFVAKLDTESTLGNIEIVKYKNSISLYPNPVTRNFSISFLSTQKNVEVIITDITGKIIYSEIVSETEKIEVNTNNFSVGTYMVQIKSEEILDTRKIVIVR